ncbi:TPA: MFS transporter, partial [Escherichia coli]
MLFIISITRDLRKVIHLKGAYFSLFFVYYKWEYDMQHNSYRRWITLAIISFSGGVS